MYHIIISYAWSTGIPYAVFGGPLFVRIIACRCKGLHNAVYIKLMHNEQKCKKTAFPLALKAKVFYSISYTSTFGLWKRIFSLRGHIIF